MSPHDLVLVIGLMLAAVAQVFIYFSEAKSKPRRQPRRDSTRVQA